MSNDSKTPNNALVLSGPDRLRALSATASDDIRQRLTLLAETVSGEIKGIGAPGEKPRLRLPDNILIKQPQSSNQAVPDGIKDGAFYTSAGEELGEELVFYPIFIQHIRKMWETGNSRIACQSLDARTGSVHGDCSVCNFGKYVEGSRMACSNGCTLWLVDKELLNVYRMDFLKTASKTGTRIQQLAKPPALWSRTFKLTTKKETSTSGQKSVWYSPVVSINAQDAPSQEVFEACDAINAAFMSLYSELLRRRDDRAAQAAASSVGGVGGGTPTIEATIVSDTDDITFDGAL